MKKVRCIVLAIMTMTVLSFASCVMYHPHNSDIPLLEEKGDLHVDASISGTLPLLDGSGLNASVAWAPLNMLGVQASGSVTDDKNYHVQGAIGTYNPIGELSVLECYIGAATGHSNYEGNNHKYTVGGQYNMFFSQINFGWNHLFDGTCDFGFGIKGGLLKPDWERVDFNSQTETWSVADTLYGPMFLLEPQLIFRIGGEHLQFSVNMAYSLIPMWPTENDNFNCARFSLGLGVHYKF